MRCARRRAWGPEPPSGLAAHLTAMALSRGNLESARGFRTAPVEIWRLNESVNCLVGVPPRRSAQDGASGEEWMLTPETRSRQRHRRMATHCDSWQTPKAGRFAGDDETLGVETETCESSRSAISTGSCQTFHHAIS
jgi:hypothetical protein